VSFGVRASRARRAAAGFGQQGGGAARRQTCGGPCAPFQGVPTGSCVRLGLAREGLLRPPTQALLVVVLAGILCEGGGSQAAQQVRLQEADSLLACGKIEEAKQLYRRLAKSGEPLGWRGLGFAALREGQFDQAKDAFDRLLKSGTDSLAAHYGLAIAHRELGARAGGLVRASHWTLADRNFAAVLRNDSSYRDVLLQLALLERYRGRYFSAVTLGMKHLARKGGSEEATFVLFQLFDHLVAHEAPDTAEGWLLRNGSSYARYFLGELYRRHGQYELADSIFRDLLGRELPFPKQPVWLSLARVYYARDDFLQADEYYWRAVREIDSNLAARFIFEDLKYVLDEEELAEYRRAATASEKIAFFTRFWERRNPRPGSPDNPRIGEHYRRLDHAERQCRFDGLRLPVSNPDVSGFLRFPQTFYLNDRFNDKGLVYIRFGEPDLRTTALDSEIASNESWLYRLPGRERPLVFHFEIDEDGAPNDWRLVPVPTDDRILESREEWDPSFTRYLRGSRLNRDQLRNELAADSQTDVTFGLTRDRHTWPEGVRVFPSPFGVAAFKGTSGTELVLLFAIEGKWLESGRDSLWEFGAAVYDLHWNMKESARRTEVIRWSDPVLERRGQFVGAHHFQLKPGDYRIGFYLEGLTTRQISGYKFLVSLPAFEKELLAVSDVLLGSVEDRPSVIWKRREENFWPTPDRRFRVGEPFWIYFEVYNLRCDEVGRSYYVVELAVEPEGGKSKGTLARLFGRFVGGAAARVRTRAERTAEGPDAFECLALEMLPRKPGRYRLTVTVEDLLAKARDRTSCAFELF